MNRKEVGELRRRFRLEREAISRVYGCYVNNNGEIVCELDESLGMLPESEAELYLGLLKKALSGTLGKNLLDIVFSTEQVRTGEEHRLLMDLRAAKLQDRDARRALYQKIIAGIGQTEDSHLILLAHDSYDVPHRNRNDELDNDNADEVFSYFVCCLCPVKTGKPELDFDPGENAFHTWVGRTVGAPELGFLFPAFDGRAANIYNALFYARKADLLPQGVIDNVFRTEVPMSAGEQKEAFQSVLAESLGEGCSMDVVQGIHEQLRERIAAHKESRDPEPLAMTVGETAAILTSCGVEQPEVEEFRQLCAEQFGENAVLTPANLIDSGKFQVKTADATIDLAPDRSYMLETRVIDGRKYLLIPADEAVEINGFGVRLKGAEG